MNGEGDEMNQMIPVVPRSYDSRRWLLLGLLMTFVFFIGCGGGGSSSSPHHHRSPTPTPTATPTPTPPPGIVGFLFDGSPSLGSPIAGATITLFQAGASGYGTGAVQLAQVSTGSDGGFNFPTITCQTAALSRQIYLLAAGGTVTGQSGPNTAIALIAGVGSCGDYAHSIVINEATTVAAVWALNQFMDSSGGNIGTSATNQTGLGNSEVALISNFVDPSMGLAPASFPDGFTSPTATLYTLADILVGCVNSSGASSSACQDLFTAATPPGGDAPTTTLQAALDVARNPVNNVSTLFALVPSSPPFTPGLASAPGSWVAELNYADRDAQLNSPYSLALDSLGNVWVTNGAGNSVSELTAGSGYTTGLNYSPSGANFNFPVSVVIDTLGNLWVANINGNSISELTAASDYSNGSNFAPAAAIFNNPFQLALDSAGNVWAANFGGNSVSELLAGCSDASCTGVNFNNSNTGSPGAVFNSPVSLIPDAAGNIWIANFTGNSVSELTSGCTSASCTGANFNNSNTGSPGAIFNQPLELERDPAGNLWAANQAGNSVSRLTAGCSAGSCTGTNINNTNSFGAALQGPTSLVLDPSANVWVTNQTGNSLSELSVVTAYATAFNFGPWETYRGQVFIANDASGNLWIANVYDDTVTEVVGIATPILTPAQACLQLGHDACLP
ncbi:MAG: NHL repeat-containing protein [Candidatus Binataceae bacterium]